LHSWRFPYSSVLLREGWAVTFPTTYWQDTKFSKKKWSLPTGQNADWILDKTALDVTITFVSFWLRVWIVLVSCKTSLTKLVSSCTCLVFPMLPLTICLWFWWDGTRWGTHYLPNILLHLVKFTTLFPTLVCNKKIPHSFQMILQQKIVAIVTTHFSWFFWQHLWKPPTKIWIGFVTVIPMYFLYI
jgi:hypothetical protein